jgi:hypothetical protein
VVHSLPLVIVVMHDVNVTVENRLEHVSEEEYGNHGPDKSGPIARREQVDHTIALQRTEWLPEALVVGLVRESNLLSTKAGDLHVNVSFQFGLNFVPLDHLDNLGLLLSSGTVGGTDFL